MRYARSLSAWLMLLVFATGSLLGPAAHRAHHAVERAPAVQAARAGTCHSEAAHNAEGPVWASEPRMAEALDCDLCATRHVVAPPATVAVPSPALHPTSWTAGAVRAVPSPPAARPVIRGPPLLS